MKKPRGAGHIASFGPFSVDLRTGELYRGGQKIKLQEKPFQVLSALLERPAELVTSEEFRGRLWPADTDRLGEAGLPRSGEHAAKPPVLPASRAGEQDRDSRALAGIRVQPG